MRGFGILLLAGLPVLAGGLDGKITGGRARKLVERAVKLIDKADVTYRSWWTKEIADDRVEPALKVAVAQYDEAATLLAEALEIKFDSSVNHRLSLAVRRLMRMEFELLWRDQKRKRERAKKNPPKEPVREKEEKEEEEEGEERPPSAPVVAVLPPRFGPQTAPGLWVDVRPPLPPINRADKAYQKRQKRDIGAIHRRISEALKSRKRGKLLTRHIMCAETGRGPDDEVCDECCGTGQVINLYHFRKVFWNGYTPLLRDTEGALDALTGFHDRARRNLEALGPVLTKFEIPRNKIEHNDFWARALVKETSRAGTNERWVTLVSIGSSWFFYTPATDAELIPGEMK
ncbi:MAG: hypothetical protein O7E54_12800 [Planctomycetota bacterium]|nr:hypothetical protein [Planctomycetota bacterium]